MTSSIVTQGSIVLTASVAKHASSGRSPRSRVVGHPGNHHRAWDLRHTHVGAVARLREDIIDALAASVPHPRGLGESDDFGRLAAELLRNWHLNEKTIRLDGNPDDAPMTTSAAAANRSANSSLAGGAS